MKYRIKILFAFLVIQFCAVKVIDAKVLEVGKDSEYKNINTALYASSNGDTIIINGGTYSGNFVISKSVSLIGKNNPVLNGNNSGTVLTIVSPSVKVEEIIIKNSGKLLDKEDAGILVKADSAVIKNNVLKSVLFGVYFLKADYGVVEDNLVEGKKELDIPRRGDLFRAWYCKNLLLSSNQFKYGRDVIIWFSENITIKNNNMSAARYGLHFMYNNDCKIIHNIMTNNSVGMYLMYSKRIMVKNNLIAENRGASGFGAGLKDMDNVELKNNVIADNRVGIFNDNSPRSYDAHINYNGNVIAYNETGMEFMTSLENSDLVKNSFIENYQQTSLSSGQDARNDYWEGNFWSDYSGYDINGDGFGEIPYKSKEMVESLLEDKPNLKIFLYSPAINALNYAAESFPILMIEPKLIDKSPSVKPDYPAGIPKLKTQKENGLFFLSFVLTIFVVLALLLFAYKNKLVKNSLLKPQLVWRSR